MNQGRHSKIQNQLIKIFKYLWLRFSSYEAILLKILSTINGTRVKNFFDQNIWRKIYFGKRFPSKHTLKDIFRMNVLRGRFLWQKSFERNFPGKQYLRFTDLRLSEWNSLQKPPSRVTFFTNVICGNLLDKSYLR